MEFLPFASVLFQVIRSDNVSREDSTRYGVKGNKNCVKSRCEVDGLMRNTAGLRGVWGGCHPYKKIKIVRKYMMKKKLSFNIFIFFLLKVYFFLSHFGIYSNMYSLYEF